MLGAIAQAAGSVLGSGGLSSIAGQGLLSALTGGLGQATGQGAPEAPKPPQLEGSDVPQVKSSADSIKSRDWNGE